jgi:hypothetical protein
MKIYSTMLYLFLALVITSAVFGVAQTNTNDTDAISKLLKFTPLAPSDPLITHNNDNVSIYLEQIEYAKTMSKYILAYGAALSLFAGIIALKTRGWSQEATKVFTVTVIVTAGLFLMTAGYTSEQIAPMYGLLGTIVGYLLGKSGSSEQDAKKPPSGG